MRPDDAGVEPLPLGLTRPIGRLRRTMVPVGTLAARVGRFSRHVGVGLRTRPGRSMVAPGTTMSVRVPEGAWALWRDALDEPTGGVTDPTMAAISARYRNRGRRVAEPPMPRGIPSVLRRRAQSRSGPGTGPMALAGRLRPADATVPRNEGHGAGVAAAAERRPAVARATTRASAPPASGRAPTAPTGGPARPPVTLPDGPVPTGAGASAAAAFAARFAAAFAPDAGDPGVGEPDVAAPGSRADVAADARGLPSWGARPAARPGAQPAEHPVTHPAEHPATRPAGRPAARVDGRVEGLDGSVPAVARAARTQPSASEAPVARAPRRRLGAPWAGLAGLDTPAPRRPAARPIERPAAPAAEPTAATPAGKGARRRTSSPAGPRPGVVDPPGSAERVTGARADRGAAPPTASGRPRPGRAASSPPSAPSPRRADPPAPGPAADASTGRRSAAPAPSEGHPAGPVNLGPTPPVAPRGAGPGSGAPSISGPPQGSTSLPWAVTRMVGVERPPLSLLAVDGGWTRSAVGVLERTAVRTPVEPIPAATPPVRTAPARATDRHRVGAPARRLAARAGLPRAARSHVAHPSMARGVDTVPMVGLVGSGTSTASRAAARPLPVAPGETARPGLDAPVPARRPTNPPPAGAATADPTAAAPATDWAARLARAWGTPAEPAGDPTVPALADGRIPTPGHTPSAGPASPTGATSSPSPRTPGASPAGTSPAGTSLPGPARLVSRRVPAVVARVAAGLPRAAATGGVVLAPSPLAPAVGRPAVFAGPSLGRAATVSSTQAAVVAPVAGHDHRTRTTAPAVWAPEPSPRAAGSRDDHPSAGPPPRDQPRSPGRRRAAAAIDVARTAVDGPVRARRPITALDAAARTDRPTPSGGEARSDERPRPVVPSSMLARSAVADRQRAAGSHRPSRADVVAPNDTAARGSAAAPRALGASFGRTGAATFRPAGSHPSAWRRSAWRASASQPSVLPMPASAPGDRAWARPAVPRPVGAAPVAFRSPLAVRAGVVRAGVEGAGVHSAGGRTLVGRPTPGVPPVPGAWTRDAGRHDIAGPGRPVRPTVAATVGAARAAERRRIDDAGAVAPVAWSALPVVRRSPVPMASTAPTGSTLASEPTAWATRPGRTPRLTHGSVGGAAATPATAVARRPAHRRQAVADHLARAGSRRGRALPTSFVPLAHLLGDAPVQIVHDADARAALRAVGRPAATVGSTILLDRAPTAEPVMVERVAHELVHASERRPSPPRLFDDPWRDHEERRAHGIGRLARTLGAEAVPSVLGPTGVLPVRLSAAEATPPVAGPSGRGAGAEAPGGAATGVTGASAPAPAPVRRAATTAARTTTVRRAAAGGGRAAATVAAATTGSRDTTVRRSPAPDVRRTVDDSGGVGPTRESTTARADRVDELVALIEARVIAQLERRGGRHRGWI